MCRFVHRQAAGGYKIPSLDEKRHAHYQILNADLNYETYSCFKHLAEAIKQCQNLDHPTVEVTCSMSAYWEG